MISVLTEKEKPTYSDSKVMDRFLYTAQLIGFTYFTDKTSVKRVPFLVVNWLATLLAGLYAWNIASSSGNLLEISLAAGIFLGVLAIIFARTAILRHLQIKRRKYLYQIWKPDYGLKSYSDYDKDSSKFVGISWNGLKANRIQMQCEAGRSGLSSIRSLKSTLENMNKTLPSRGNKWVIEFDLLKLGTMDAHIVPDDSVEYAEFAAKTRVFEMSQNMLDYGDLPKVSFVKFSSTNGNVDFESVILEHDMGQHFSKSVLETFEVTFGQYFPAPSGMRWGAVHEHGSVILTKRKGFLSDSELELIQEARERAIRYDTNSSDVA